MEIKDTLPLPDASFEETLETAIFINYHTTHPLPTTQQIKSSWEQLQQRLHQQKETGLRLG
ncbi:hypothetical protein B5M42_020025 [Paenibacillus athensensis]|uniref:Uncharacterized protein n=1 Tax=Paenibacillus athensensis TaxID=1967502 RepID=A0A4Y8Q0B3_9BACL|nr:hypothetical protein [Paenibacillus athensensis]MCD1261096.1 hypothetical protein [Paenibacillus athensensis]